MKAVFAVFVFGLWMGAVAQTATPTPTPEASPAPSTEGDDGVCFPGSVEVITSSGVKLMKDLEIGDRVLTAGGRFSEVHYFSHRVAGEEFTFTKINTDAGVELTLSARHYTYVDGELRAAQDVKVGDSLELADGSSALVTSVEAVKETGLYAPHTMVGEMIVSGARVSCYTKTVPASLAHILLAPLRFAYSSGVTVPAILDNGASRTVLNMVPQSN